MREKLAAIEGKRCTFRGRFERFGSKRSFRGPPKITILLTGIEDPHGNAMCDHLWFIQGKLFERLKLSRGDVVEFVATVIRYTKGYRGHREDEDCSPVSEDFRLSRPSHLRVIGTPTMDQPMPLFAFFDTPPASSPA